MMVFSKRIASIAALVVAMQGMLTMSSTTRILSAPAAVAKASVNTDKLAYVPGDHVIATGSGWLPYAALTLTYTEIATTDPNGSLHAPVVRYALADANGNFSSANDPSADFVTDQNHNATVTMELTAAGTDANGAAATALSPTFTNGVTVATDYGKYALGQPITISGAGFTPGASIGLSILRPDHTTDTLSGGSTAGTFSTVYTPPLVPGRYKITATDGIYSAMTAVTQADNISVDFKQCANNDPSNTGVNLGECHWIGSILQSSNSRIFEGMSTLQRMVFDAIPASTNSGTYRMQFHMDALKSTAHAYDFVTTWDTAIDATDETAPAPITQDVPLYPQILKLRTPAANDLACGPAIPDSGQPPTLRDICLALRNSTNLNVTYADLNPAQVAGFDPVIGDNVAPKVAAYQNRYGLPLYGSGNQKHAIKFYSNAPIDTATFNLLGYDAQGNSNWELTWHSTGTPTQLLIEFGAHVAVGTDFIGYGVGYGAGKGASNINGGPYHVSVDLFDFGLAGNGDDTSLGAQDNQLKGADILIPPSNPTIVTHVHDANHTNITNSSVPLGTVVHDRADIDTGSSTNVIPSGSTVTFYRFDNASCSGSPVVTQSNIAVPSGSQTAFVESNTFTPGSGGYSYLVDFESGDLTKVLSKAGDPAQDCEPFMVNQSTVTVTTAIHNAAHTVVRAVAVGTTVHDDVTVTQPNGLPAPTGNVNIDWFLNNTCSGSPAANSGSVGPLSGGMFDATGFAFTVNSAGLRAFKGHYEGDPNYQAADGPCEPLQVVDANIALTPSTAFNPIGTNHTLTCHINVNDGSGFANAPDGITCTGSIVSGPGSFVGANSCMTSGGTGSCSLVITSATTGTTEVQATTTVSVAGVSLTRTTGDGKAGDSGNAKKTWVNARISIAPNATNEVGQPHTFTVTVEKNTGSGFVPANGEHVDVTLTDSNGASHSAPTGSCTNAGPNTDASGQCTITFTSSTAGKVTGHATSTLSIDNISITIATDGVAPNSGDAVKTFVDANIQLTPSLATNRVGTNHTLTCHINVNNGSGAGFVNVPDGATCTGSIFSGPGSFVGSNSCLTAGGTGSCALVITNASPGVTTVRAMTTVSVGGVSLTRTTGDGKAGDSGNAVKNWVDARISIGTSGTNPITTAHTFTVTVEKNAGSGWVPAAGVTVNTTLAGGSVGTITGGTCGPSGSTNGSGQCAVTVNSLVPGSATVNASTTVAVGTPSINVNVATNGYGAFSISNVKTWFDTHVQLTKLVNGGTPSASDPAFEFQLWQGLSAATPGVLLETRTTTPGSNNILNFTKSLVPGGTYQICELVVFGYTPDFNGFGSFNPGGNNPGYFCFNFTANSSSTTLSLTVDNHHETGSGLALTIGYWKNWASCKTSRGHQDPSTDRVLQSFEPGGFTIGTLTLHDTNPDPDVATDCDEVVNLLNKTDINGGKGKGVKKANDPLFNMAAQYTAYLLNVRNGAPACSAVGDAAQALLAAHNFDGVTYSPALNADQAAYANALNNLLDAYNNNNGCGVPPPSPNPL